MSDLSVYGERIVGSEIIKISQEIKKVVSEGKEVINYTIGDFDPSINSIPELLNELIHHYYQDGKTNYPFSSGELSLRESVSAYLSETQMIQYSPSNILVGCGVRPLIYLAYKTLINAGDGIIFPVPSWNNNHYTMLHQGLAQPIECSHENDFFPTVDQVRNTITEDTRMVCICSPQNPTGKTISANVLSDICKLIVDVNAGRDKKIWLLYDQIYSDLSQTDFIHPSILVPEIHPYLVCLDGVSKSLCATGVRVGWIFGPDKFIQKATEVFSHIGAWAAKPEQLAVGEYLKSSDIKSYLVEKKSQYSSIFKSFCDFFETAKNNGYWIDYKKPDGGIYISLFIGYALNHEQEQFCKDLIKENGIGIVPFKYFGSKENDGWFRISIGNVDSSNMEYHLEKWKSVLAVLRTRHNSLAF